MFPKTGNSFPREARGRVGSPNYARAISATLRNELGDTHQAAKTLMRWTGANERTVKHWLAGTHGPKGEHLIAVVRQSEAVLETFLRLAGRTGASATPKLVDVRLRLRDLLAVLDAALDQTAGSE